MVEDILELKSFLLNPKRSDEFKTWYYLDGWRMCTVKVGSKKCTVTPMFGRGKINLTIRNLKEELNKLYWYAAKCHASRGKKKRSLRWESDYA